MTTHADEQLIRYTDADWVRPVPAALIEARTNVRVLAEALLRIPDSVLARPWAWKGGSEEEVRYVFYRISEAFERAGIEAAAELRQAGVDRGRAAELIAPATTARWNLQGLLAALDEPLWTADPGGGEWSIARTLGHVINGQRYYGVSTAWWQDQGYWADDPNLPARTPDAVFVGLPDEEDEALGSPAVLRVRLDEVLDASAERLAGIPADRLATGARWSGFAVDIGFRLGRWSSHIREHTIQVEKTLAMLGHQPTEVDRLVRIVFAAWGAAEATVYGAADGDAAVNGALGMLAAAAADARPIAEEVASQAAGS